jgi:hypothetical protein
MEGLPSCNHPAGPHELEKPLWSATIPLQKSSPGAGQAVIGITSFRSIHSFALLPLDNFPQRAHNSVRLNDYLGTCVFTDRNMVPGPLETGPRTFQT